MTFSTPTDCRISAVALLIATTLAATSRPIASLAAEERVWPRKPDQASQLKPQATLRGHTGRVISVVYSPDGKSLATGSLDGTVKLWDVATLRPKSTLKRQEAEGVTSVAFSPNGKLLAVGSLDHTVAVWEPATGRLKTVLRGHTGKILSVAFSPDGQTLATGARDVSMRLWDPVSGKLKTTLDASYVVSIAFSPDGKYLAARVEDGFTDAVLLWDTKTYRSKRKFAADDDRRWVISEVTFSPDGKILALAWDDGIVTLWNAETGKETAVLEGPIYSVNSAVFSADGKILALGGGAFEGLVIVWDVRRREVKAAFTVDSEHTVYSLALSPNGKLLASATDKTVQLWDVSQVLEHGIEKWAIPKKPQFVAESQRQQVSALKKLGAHVGLRRNGTVMSVSVPYGKLSDDDLKLLEGLGTIEDLTLIGPNLSDTGLAVVRRLTNLKTLAIHATTMSDAGVAHIRDLTKLHGLKLELCNVSEAGLPAIRALTQLRNLSLVGTDVTDLAELKHLPKLQSLDLDHCPIGDDELRHLIELKHLQTLHLGWTEVTDRGLRHLGQLKQLQELSLCDDRVTDAGLKHLHSLANLERLYLAGAVGKGFQQGVSFVTERGLDELHQAIPEVKVFGLPRRDDAPDLEIRKPSRPRTGEDPTSSSTSGN